MSRRWVVNASPLILLAKAEQLDLLPELCSELVIPEGVVEEVGAKPDGVLAVEHLLDLSPSVGIVPCRDVPREIAVWDLGRGESEVLAVAAAEQGRVVIDDLEARRCAEAFGLDVIGTLGVILRARRRNLLPAARPVVERLRRVGLWVSDDLVERALDYLGE